MYGADYVKIVGAFFDYEMLCLDCTKKSILEIDPQAVIENDNDVNAWLLQKKIRGADYSPLLAYQAEDWTPDGLYCDQCSAAIFEADDEELEEEEEE
jgi:hypothetical protein